MAAIHHVALRVARPEVAARFYSDVLGLPETRRFHEGGAVKSIWLDAGGVILMLERSLRGAGADEGSGHLFAIAVEDLAAWERRLDAAGIAIVDRTEHTLYVCDPDGHRVGLSTYPR